MRSKPTGRRAAAPATSSARAAFVPRSNHSPLPGHRWAAAPVPAAAGTNPWVRNGSLALAVTGIVAAVALSQVHPPTADGTTQAQAGGGSPTASAAANVTLHSDWLTTDAVIDGYLDGHKIDGGSSEGLFASKASTGEALFASNGGIVVNGSSADGNIVDADGSGRVVANGAAGNVPAAGSLDASGESTPELAVTQQPITEPGPQPAESAHTPASGPAQSSGSSSDQPDGDGMQALSGTPDAGPDSASDSGTQTDPTPVPAPTEDDGTTAAAVPSGSTETTPAPAPTESGETSPSPAPTEGAGTSPIPTAEPTSPSPKPTSPSPKPTSPSAEPTSPSAEPTSPNAEPTSTSLESMEPSHESTTSSPEPEDGTDRDGWNGYGGEGWSDGDDADRDDSDESDGEGLGGNDRNYRYGNN
ncbi:hypothetical protein [Arthrobacter sp. H14]|uniref:hypothetical protein n=1 Tax=Arthrobacter sp. H14 TaxID=1312959 RepID=UPI00047DD01A|nr:hypothetical protein [Arthrobacter sp. H14]